MRAELHAELFAPIEGVGGIKATKAEIASWFGETIASVDTWVRQGCPCYRTGKVRSPLVFYSAQVFAWRRIMVAFEAGGEHLARIVRLEVERDAAEYQLWRMRVEAGLEAECTD